MAIRRPPSNPAAPPPVAPAAPSAPPAPSPDLHVVLRPPIAVGYPIRRYRAPSARKTYIKLEETYDAQNHLTSRTIVVSGSEDVATTIITECLRIRR